MTIVKEDSASAGQGRSRTRLRNLLVGVQVAGCTVLLVLAGLLVRGLHRAEKVDPGFATRNVYVLTFDLTQKGYDAQRAGAFLDQVQERLRTVPGIHGVATSEVLPCVTAYISGVTVPDSKSDREQTQVWANLVSPDYFKTMQVPIIRGRSFTAEDIKSGGALPAVISAAMQKKFWPQEGPIGKEFNTGKNGRYRVVAIAPDLQNQHLGQIDGPFYYAAMPAGSPELMDAKLFVRTSTGSSGAVSAVPEIVHQLDASVLVTTDPFEQILSSQLTPARTGAALVGILGALAMLLAVAGITGVVSYAASQRMHEVGIRLALGAQPRDVVLLLVRQIARVVAIAAGIGVVLAAGAGFLLSSADLLFGVSPFDPVAFIGTAVLLAAIALCSMLIPAWRSSGIDPMVMLRYE